MNDTPTPETRAAQVAAVFERIRRTDMAGLPLLNEALEVATLGFGDHEGRTLGMLVTPWMMGLLLFPGPDDDWRGMALGEKTSHAFPGGIHRFMVNRVDGLGVYQMHSVHSPMRAFADQGAALAEAAAFLDRLLNPPGADAVAADPVDEELLGRILRGEATPAVDAAVGAMPDSPDGGRAR